MERVQPFCRLDWASVGGQPQAQEAAHHHDDPHITPGHTSHITHRTSHITHHTSHLATTKSQLNVGLPMERLTVL